MALFRNGTHLTAKLLSRCCVHAAQAREDNGAHPFLCTLFISRWHNKCILILCFIFSENKLSPSPLSALGSPSVTVSNRSVIYTQPTAQQHCEFVLQASLRGDDSRETGNATAKNLTQNPASVAASKLLSGEIINKAIKLSCLHAS